MQPQPRSPFSTAIFGRPSLGSARAEVDRLDATVLSRLLTSHTDALHNGLEDEDAPPSGPVTALSFDNRSGLLASVCDSGSLLISNARLPGFFHRVHREQLCEMGSTLHDVQWSAADETLAVAGSRGDIYLMDTTSHSVSRQRAHSGGVKAIRFVGPSSQLLVSAGRDGSVLLYDERAGGSWSDSALAPAWSLQAAGGTRQFTRAAAAVTSIAVVDHYLLVASEAGRLSAWDCRRLPRASGGSPAAAATSLDSSRKRPRGALASSVAPAPANCCGALLQISQPTTEGREYGITGIDVSPCSTSLLVSYTSSRMLVYNLAQMLCGAGGASGASFEYVIPQAEAGRVTAAAPAAGSSSSAPRTSEFITPDRSGVRRGKAWRTVGVDSPGEPLVAAAAAAAAASSSTVKRGRPSATSSASARAVPSSSSPSNSSVSLQLPGGDGDSDVSTEELGARGRIQASSVVARRFSELGGHVARGSFFVKSKWSRCGRFIVSGSADGKAYIWHAPQTGALHRAGTAGHSFDSYTSSLASSSASLSSSLGTDDIYATTSTPPLPSFRCPAYVLHGQTSEVGDVAWGGTSIGSASTGTPLSDQLRIAVGCDSGTVRLWYPGIVSDTASWLRGNRSLDTNGMCLCCSAKGPQELQRRRHAWRAYSGEGEGVFTHSSHFEARQHPPRGLRESSTPPDDVPSDCEGEGEVAGLASDDDDVDDDDDRCRCHDDSSDDGDGDDGSDALSTDRERVRAASYAVLAAAIPPQALAVSPAATPSAWRDAAVRRRAKAGGHLFTPLSSAADEDEGEGERTVWAVPYSSVVASVSVSERRWWLAESLRRAAFSAPPLPPHFLRVFSSSSVAQSSTASATARPLLPTTRVSDVTSYSAAAATPSEAVASSLAELCEDDIASTAATAHDRAGGDDEEDGEDACGTTASHRESNFSPSTHGSATHNRARSVTTSLHACEPTSSSSSSTGERQNSVLHFPLGQLAHSGCGSLRVQRRGGATAAAIATPTQLQATSSAIRTSGARAPTTSSLLSNLPDWFSSQHEQNQTALQSRKKGAEYPSLHASSTLLTPSSSTSSFSDAADRRPVKASSDLRTLWTAAQIRGSSGNGSSTVAAPNNTVVFEEGSLGVDASRSPPRALRLSTLFGASLLSSSAVAAMDSESAAIKRQPGGGLE